MKVIWEEQDIKAGRRFRSLYGREIWIIGYIAASPTKWTVVSTLDGMVNSLLKTRQDVVDFLNRNEDLPLELLDDSWRKEIEPK